MSLNSGTIGDTVELGFDDIEASRGPLYEELIITAEAVVRAYLQTKAALHSV